MVPQGISPISSEGIRFCAEFSLRSLSGVVIRQRLGPRVCRRSMTDPWIEPIESPSRSGLWFSTDAADDPQNLFQEPLSFCDPSFDALPPLPYVQDAAETSRPKRKQEDIVPSGPSYRFKLDPDRPAPDCDEYLPTSSFLRPSLPTYLSSPQQEDDIQNLHSPPLEAQDPEPIMEPRDITDERWAPLIQVLDESDISYPTNVGTVNNNELVDLDSFLQLLDNPAVFGEEEDVAQNADSSFSNSSPPSSPSAILAEVVPKIEAAEPRSPSSFRSLEDACLVITVHPELRSYLKSASTDAPHVEVELRGVPAHAIVGPVRAISTLAAMPVINDPQAFERNRARFDLRFSKSNSVQPCSVYFEALLALPSGEQRVVQSQPSEPFIMRTNISQYLKAERTLVLQTVFAGAEVVPWPTLGVALSRHFFFTTGKERTLASRDVRFLHRLLGGGDRILLSSFMTFWDWYGEVTRLFTDKNVRRLWTQRIVYGFSQKCDLPRVLQAAGVATRPGLFVLALVESERTPVVAWVHRDGSVRMNTLKRGDLREPFRVLLGNASYLNVVLRPSLVGGSNTYELTPKTDVIQMLLPKKMSAVRKSTASASPTPQPCHSPPAEVSCHEPDVATRYDDELS